MLVGLTLSLWVFLTGGIVVQDSEVGESPQGLGVSMWGASYCAFRLLSTSMETGWKVSSLMCGGDSILVGERSTFP